MPPSICSLNRTEIEDSKCAFNYHKLLFDCCPYVARWAALSRLHISGPTDYCSGKGMLTVDWTVIGREKWVGNEPHWAYIWEAATRIHQLKASYHNLSAKLTVQSAGPLGVSDQCNLNCFGDHKILQPIYTFCLLEQEKLFKWFADLLAKTTRVEDKVRLCCFFTFSFFVGKRVSATIF